MQKLTARSDRYIASLKAGLRITESQSEAWAAFVDALQSNRERIQSAAGESAPFGAIADRLAALGAMRRVTSRLYVDFNASQREAAGRLLPLCCQPAILCVEAA